MKINLMRTFAVLLLALQFGGVVLSACSLIGGATFVHAEEKVIEEPVVEEVVEVEPEIVVEEVKVRYFDIPLSTDLQDHIFATCEKYGVQPSIIVAMIKKESEFNAGVIGDGGNSFGLMQIQPRWHRARMDSLGCSNLLDPYQNVTVGISLFADLYSKGGSIEWALMAYNGGESYANSKWRAGVVSEYARTVLTNSDIFERGRI